MPGVFATGCGAAIISSGFKWPLKRVTVNLAPSGLRKAGPGLDVAIALGVMAADDQLPARLLGGLAFIGELGLDGSLRRVPGVLPLVAAVEEPTVVVAPACAREASYVERSTVRAVGGLRELVQALKTSSGWPELPAAVSTDEAHGHQTWLRSGASRSAARHSRWQQPAAIIC